MVSMRLVPFIMVIMLLWTFLTYIVEVQLIGQLFYFSEEVSFEYYGAIESDERLFAPSSVEEESMLKNTMVVRWKTHFIL